MASATSGGAYEGASCIVCVMEISLDYVLGRQYYTGQIDVKSRLPHGLGTLSMVVNN